MKKILYLFATLLMVSIMFACSSDKKDPIVDQEIISGKDAIYLRPYKPLTRQHVPPYDTCSTYNDSIKSIFKCKQFAMNFSHNSINFGQNPAFSLINEDLVDRENYWFKVDTFFVVYNTGIAIELGVLVDAWDVVITSQYDGPYEWLYDTIAYIPNKVIKEASAKIRPAFARGDYDECRRIFNNDYKFIPIDGKAYKKLKAAGLH